MARMRSLKPEYFKDQDLAADLPGPRGREARLLYPGLWCLADEWGRLRGDARSIKGELYAYDDDVTPKEVDEFIDMLVDAGRAIRYQVGRSIYIYLPKLAKHQRLEPHKTPSRLPPPPDDLLEQYSLRFSQNLPDQSENFPDKSAPRQAASSMEHVAGSKAESPRAAQKIPANPPPTPPQAHEAAEIVIAATACPPYLAAETVLAIHRERKPRNLAALVQTLIKAGELGTWMRKAQAVLDAEAREMNKGPS